jgi:hypothetical protein
LTSCWVSNPDQTRPLVKPNSQRHPRTWTTHTHTPGISLTKFPGRVLVSRLRVPSAESIDLATLSEGGCRYPLSARRWCHQRCRPRLRSRFFKCKRQSVLGDRRWAPSGATSNVGILHLLLPGRGLAMMRYYCGVIALSLSYGFPPGPGPPSTMCSRPSSINLYVNRRRHWYVRNRPKEWVEAIGS